MLDQVLAADCDRLAVVGVVRGRGGAPRCLPRRASGHGRRVRPTAVVWQGAADGGTAPTSKWTWRGAPLPFVPYDQTWRPTTEPPEFRDLYERSLRRANDAAHIPVERIRGEVLLVAGGDDRVWDSVAAAGVISLRRKHCGLTTTLLTHDRAGHRTPLPGEDFSPARAGMVYGGDAASDADLGRAAWPVIASTLRLANAVSAPVPGTG